MKSSGFFDRMNIHPEKTMKHIWVSLGLTVLAAIALFASSVWAVVSDDECNSNLCFIGGWAICFVGAMSVNVVIGFYTALKARKLFTISSSKDAIRQEETQAFIPKMPEPAGPQLSSESNIQMSNNSCGAGSHRVPSWLIWIVFIENSITMAVTLILLYTSMMCIIFWTHVDDEDTNFIYIAFMASLIFSVIAEFYTLLAKLAFLEVSGKDRNKMILLASNLLLLAMGLTLIVMNSRLSHLDRWVFHGMISVGCICCISAASGIFITAVTHSSIGPQYLSSTALPIPYLLIEMFTLGLCSVFTIGNIWYAVILEITPSHHRALTGLELNSAVGAVICVTTSLIHFAYDYMLNPPLPTDCVATRVDLGEVDDETLQRWGQMISYSYGTKYIGSWDGHAALSLMKTYMKVYTGGKHSNVPHVKCVVLKVERKNNKSQGDPELGAMRGGDGGDPAAIVFITIVEKFDLTRYLTGCLGRAMGCMFGAHGCIPILSLRWGLIGFQYPFHSGIFLMNKQADALREMTQVQRAVVRWNDGSPLRCNVLMAPSLITQADYLAFETSAFLNLQVGPIAIADLRRYKGLTYKEFQRVALKKGNRRNHHNFFAKHGGTAHISRKFTDFDPNYASVHEALCSSTAAQRTAKGELPVLYPVTKGHVRLLAEDHKQSYRNVFGIRVNGAPAGSAVLFEFPETKLLTCDMQGLRHEIARPARAYFAMLAMAVEKALTEGYDFLDFGPTTLAPKMDVGARLIPCRAGYHTRNMLMRALLKQGQANWRAQQQDVEDKMAFGSVLNEQHSEAAEREKWRASNLGYVEADFQVCTQRMRASLGHVGAEIVTYEQEHDQKNSNFRCGAAPKTKNNNCGGKKKSKKQLNKEKRKAARKAARKAKKDKQQAQAKPQAQPRSQAEPEGEKPKPKQKPIPVERENLSGEKNESSRLVPTITPTLLPSLHPTLAPTNH
mmetsp:Transcript_22616/g.39990  ORF Transcript_22616/g.39990 Transcript_22616/m.39990 type:complete len:953 (-) Transcript_22616:50-2908(-)|eukprot:CAMPEP_0197530272 /NCGR_PEP_ID=MMETSP1318-20131121/31289_1 /TAXON_ID=552666 /ORGANISM="Partenskyella glossopodia, Strain RCC365" /LENGTH=952 /DNA_ID=CAMNT_0043086017 /DNA_START=65 /DNA_END=2923 /DNA_ORIENTATION=-